MAEINKEDSVKNAEIKKTKKKMPVKKKKVAIKVRNVSKGQPKAAKKEIAVEPMIVKEEKESEIESKLNEVKKTKEKIFQFDEKPAQPTVVEKKKVKKQSNFYRRLALTFVFLSVLLLVAISYFAYSKVVITLVSSVEKISDSQSFEIRDFNKQTVNESEKDVLSGVVEEVAVNTEKQIDSSGAEKIGEEVIGRVVIINNYTKNQPLVATTRLLSADGKLYRLKNTVNVPAGGQIEAEVYADAPSTEMAIGPSRFTIPGLWAGIQDKIYAESKAKFVYQAQTKKHITQADVDRGISDIKNDLLGQIKQTYASSYKGFDTVLYKFDDNSIKLNVDSKVGDEKDSFKIKIEGQAVIVAFDKEPVLSFSNSKLKLMVPDNKEIIDFNNQSITYSLDTFDVKQGMATITASFEGKMRLKKDSKIIDRQKITGLNEAQLSSYLKSFKELSGYEIRFYPSFIKRVPDLIDRIEVQVK
jgi:hypothetical protein